MVNQRPEVSEYCDFQEVYIARVPQEGSLTEILREQTETAAGLFGSLSEEQGDYRYAPGKWSIKEMLGHLIDNDRIMSYRVLCFARGEQAQLPGYEEKDYADAGNYGRFTLAELVRHYRIVRASTLLLFESLSEEAWTSRGMFSGVAMTARAQAAIIVGHELHHLAVLKERYLQ